MGGTGSGRWAHHDKKRTVKECWVLDILEVVRGVELRVRPRSGNACRPCAARWRVARMERRC